jgi:hypothetical protein
MESGKPNCCSLDALVHNLTTALDACPLLFITQDHPCSMPVADLARAAAGLEQVWTGEAAGVCYVYVFMCVFA